MRLDEQTQYREQRGGKVTDGLVRIRGKSGWVSDRNSPKTDGEAAMRECRGKGEGISVQGDVKETDPNTVS